MPLTDVKIRNATPRERPFKLFDEEGLYLEVRPTGAKLWRLKYRFAGKEKRIALGRYPEVTLKDARKRRDKARVMLSDGIDPSEVRRQTKQRQRILSESAFEIVARKWMADHLKEKSDGHRARVRRCLEREAFPAIGKRPVSEVTTADVRAIVERVHRRGTTDTARRTAQYIGMVFRYAIACGLAESDPTAALRGFLPKKETRHMPAPTDPVRVGEILRALDAFQGTPTVAAAIRLLPYLFCRPGELRTMRWEDVHLDGDHPEWRYTVGKTNTPHLVPLSHQAVAILEELQPLTGHLPGGWVFPGGRTPLRPMSDMAMGAAYRRLGLDTREEITPHGWRSVARTLLHERLGYPGEVIEHQLAHAVPDALGRAYNRTRFLDKRREMMQRWADYLDMLRAGDVGKVVALKAGR
ncbi:MAG: DUF4102 domain-containing protein [Caldilineae bacterium]|nr:MAG: DUF4102 domain-containing protein [Caldilineae bacterium]